MITEKIEEGLYRITPYEGNHLTQAYLGEEDVRVFCCSAYELTEDDASKWIEWSESMKQEYEEMLLEKERAMQEENDSHGYYERVIR